MTSPATVEAEAAARRWATPAAAAAGALPFAAGVASVLMLRDGPENKPAQYLFINDRAAGLNAAAAVRAIGILALGAALLYLFRAVKARRPQLPRMFLWFSLAGALGSALCGAFSQTPAGVVTQAVTALKAGEFASEGSQTYQQIIDLGSAPVFAVVAIAELLSTLLLAIAISLLSLNAMRVGLVSRLFGYIGIFAGVFVVFPLGQPVPVILSLWLVARAALFAGAWPGGRPPAWASGDAEPWPPGGGAWRDRSAPAEPEQEPERSARNDPPAAPPARPVHAGETRRKRKQRR